MQKKSKISIMYEGFFKIFWGPHLKKYTFLKTKGFFFFRKFLGAANFLLTSSAPGLGLWTNIHPNQTMITIDFQWFHLNWKRFTYLFNYLFFMACYDLCILLYVEVDNIHHLYGGMFRMVKGVNQMSDDFPFPFLFLSFLTLFCLLVYLQ